ncbi:MAG: DNA gyrase inhibitor YacG [Candidatus Marinimicrobia bacterium]|nr:DNA gyrase inhibitor YacG [Candidatus Neomarinimicrobiota bacterium]|tara:strand:- start:11721 stop:11900 length:180 start_codon:yes stop_codon:yes gene_type:complete
MEINKKKLSNLVQLRKKSKCPSCSKISKDPFIPFCSKKCSNIDLMKWLTDEYQIRQKVD